MRTLGSWAHFRTFISKRSFTGPADLCEHRERRLAPVSVSACEPCVRRLMRFDRSACLSSCRQVRPRELLTSSHLKAPEGALAFGTMTNRSPPVAGWPESGEADRLATWPSALRGPAPFPVIGWSRRGRAPWLAGHAYFGVPKLPFSYLWCTKNTRRGEARTSTLGCRQCFNECATAIRPKIWALRSQDSCWCNARCVHKWPEPKAMLPPDRGEWVCLHELHRPSVSLKLLLFFFHRHGNVRIC
jgi:hypothetical protein